mmetsp:Transcript_163114/g.313303  ORF Transcript_163114/g.313303 Transcript_163114/m.313303 type:complete len:464 (-) Transcript_163114:318-1709(-)
MEFTCAICFQTAGSRLELPVFRTGNGDKLRECDCGHPICCECMSQHVRVRVEEQRVFNLHCPFVGCRTELFEQDLQRLVFQTQGALSSELCQRFVKLRARDFSARIASFDDMVPRIEEDAELLLSLHEMRVCPRCKLVIQRSEGCDDFFCLCGERFNYAAAARPVCNGVKNVKEVVARAKDQQMTVAKATRQALLADARDGGVSAAELKATYSVNELRAAGYSAHSLFHSGISINSLKEAGYPIADMPHLTTDEERELRKIEKQLREIAKIESRIAAGDHVDQLQRQKIGKKDKLLGNFVMVKLRAGYLRAPPALPTTLTKETTDEDAKSEISEASKTAEASTRAPSECSHHSLLAADWKCMEMQQCCRKVFKFVTGVLNQAFSTDKIQEHESEIRAMLPLLQRDLLFSDACDALAAAIEAGIIPQKGLDVLKSFLPNDMASRDLHKALGAEDESAVSIPKSR